MPNFKTLTMIAQHDRLCTISSIAASLNDGGVPTKKAGQIINGKETSGLWHPLTVQRVLEHAELASEEELAAAP